MQASYLELRVGLLPPANQAGWRGWQARAYVAKHLDGKPGVSDLMRSISQEHENQISLIRFLGGKKSFRIVAINEGIPSLLNISQYIPHLEESPYLVTLNGGQLGLSPDTHKTYVSSIVPFPKGSSSEHTFYILMQQYRDEPSNELLKKAIHTSLEKRIVQLFENQQLGMGSVSIVKPHIRLYDWDLRCMIPLKGKIYLPLMNVRFYSDIEFKGPWSIGSLTSRGHGQLYRWQSASMNIRSKAAGAA